MAQMFDDPARPCVPVCQAPLPTQVLLAEHEKPALHCASPDGQVQMPPVHVPEMHCEPAVQVCALVLRTQIFGVPLEQLKPVGQSPAPAQTQLLFELQVAVPLQPVVAPPNTHCCSCTASLHTRLAYGVTVVIDQSVPGVARLPLQVCCHSHAEHRRPIDVPALFLIAAQAFCACVCVTFAHGSTPGL